MMKVPYALQFVSLAAALTTCVLSGCGGRATASRPPNMDTALVIRDILQAGAEAQSGPAKKELPQPTGWATLTGKFIVQGNAPEMAPLTVDKQLEVCGVGGPKLQEDVVVGPGGELANVLIYLETAYGQDIPIDSAEPNPKWVNEMYNPENNPQWKEKVFDQLHCEFVSHVMAIAPSQTLVLKNSDSVSHNTKIDTKKNVSINPNLPANSTDRHNFTRPERGPAKVTCGAHSWMGAYLMVCPNPYYAVTDKNGVFTIEKVPAGVELEFRAWQERANYLTEVRVTSPDAQNETQKWNKGRFKITLEPDQEYHMDVVVDASALQ